MNNFDISRINLLIYDAVLLFSYTKLFLDV